MRLTDGREIGKFPMPVGLSGFESIFLRGVERSCFRCLSA